MNKLKLISLKILIPLILLIGFLIFQTGIFYFDHQFEKDKIFDSAQKNALNISYNIRSSASVSSIDSEFSQLQHLVSAFALNDLSFKNIMIIDNKKQILVSNNFKYIDLIASNELEFFNSDFFMESLTLKKNIIKYNTDTNELRLYVPLKIVKQGEKEALAFNGSIFINYSLDEEFKILNHDTYILVILVVLGVLFMILLLTYVFKLVLIDPLRNLTFSTTLDLQNQLEYNFCGVGEIGELQRKFVDLAGNVKKNISELSANEQRWLYALSGSRDGVWDWDIENNKVYFSNRWKEILGYQIDEIDDDITQWEYKIHPNDLFNVLQDLEFHFIGRTSYFENTHQLRCKNGEYRWILSRGQTVSWDIDGKPLRVIGTSTDVSIYKDSIEQIRYRSQFDEITKLPNRENLLQHIKQEINRSQKTAQHGAIIYFESNQYKNINDLEGHKIGESLLSQIAERLLEVSNETDLIAHIQGGKFVFVLSDLSTDNEKAGELALSFAKRVEDKLSDSFVLDDSEIELTCSFGITVFPDNEMKAEDLLRQSAIAMKKAFDSNIYNISFFAKNIEEKIVKRQCLEQQIVSGLENKEFSLSFQPRVDENSNLIGAEALLRWLHSSLGWISPSEFIPIAEGSGLIVELGDWVLLTSMRYLAQWTEIGLPANFKTLSINVSPNQLLEPDFLRKVAMHIADTGVEPSLIEIEITESILVSNIELVMDKLNRLRDMGIRLSIDDFGTGYSSLSYLATLPVSTLKIDNSFVDNLLENRSQQVIVKAILNMAETLELDVVAEGVSTDEQLQLLIEKGCKQFQGYFVGKPLAKNDFQSLLYSADK